MSDLTAYFNRLNTPKKPASLCINCALWDAAAKEREDAFVCRRHHGVPAFNSCPDFETPLESPTCADCTHFNATRYKNKPRKYFCDRGCITTPTATPWEEEEETAAARCRFQQAAITTRLRAACILNPPKEAAAPSPIFRRPE